MNELSTHLGVSRSVVQRYLRLLEQSFIIKVIRPFSNNPRNEIKKAFKVIFLDIGVRNALVDVEKSLPERDDKGFIFESYFISERVKIGNNNKVFPPEVMFWRTRSGDGVDVVEKTGTELAAFECKWTKTQIDFEPFLRKYPKADVRVITSMDLLL